MLSQERLKEVIDYDPETGRFTWKVNKGRQAKAGNPAGSLMQNGYIIIRVDGHRVTAQRLAWLYMTGNQPGDTVDHINGIRDDNRFINLRSCSYSTNNSNKIKHRPNKHGMTGVSLNNRCKTRPYCASIKLDGRRKKLGNFSTPEEAHAAYVEAKNRLHLPRDRWLSAPPVRAMDSYSSLLQAVINAHVSGNRHNGVINIKLSELSDLLLIVEKSS